MNPAPSSRRTLLLAAILALLLPGCGAQGMGVSQNSSANSERPEHRATAGLETGKQIYQVHCAGCHGARGDGRGPAARFLDPKPADFTRGIFKFASVKAGQLPRDEDLLRTLTRGLPGSSMPSWQALPDENQRAVIAYLKTFSPAWSRNPPGIPIAVSEDPYRSGGPEAARQAVARGREVYHVVATCWQCHAAYASPEEVDLMAKARDAGPVKLRAQAEQPATIIDARGRRIATPDFRKSPMKNGSSLVDLYKTIGAGIGGTAMPSWKDALEEKDLWALTYYVKSLADERWRRPRSVPGTPAESEANPAARYRATLR
ncbi:MAG TPA: c-type cytochrome [Candidatus Polarisedimenticolia bacterium]|nr:c-type cytochrome [Candidatus Polarisedimenticolia bacterium]